VVPEVAAHPRTIVADSWTANAEQILATGPNLVIASEPYPEKAAIEIPQSTRCRLRSIPNSLPARKESGRLPLFHLPQRESAAVS
jgi:hypothetical protein